jgi:hypothetical protein
MELFIDYQIPTDLLSYSPATVGRGAGGGGVEAQRGLVADSGASDILLLGQGATHQSHDNHSIA